MDCQQDLAINTLTILDDCNESSILCHGNAVFKNSVKIFNNMHINNDIRTCGNIIPLNHTSSIGSLENMWMDLFVTDGNFNKINTDVLNVKQLNIKNVNVLNSNCIANDKKNEYVNLNDLDKNYNLFKIKYNYDIDNSELCVDVIMCDNNNNYIIIDLTNLSNDIISRYCDEKLECSYDIENILYVNNKNIIFKFILPDIGNKIKMIIINPENYNITFNKYNVQPSCNVYNNSYQTYKFLYLNDINKWLLIYKI
jgi:hypothetical protein